MNIKSIFVLGSTSLVANELCLALANKGCKEFHLVSRNYQKNTFLINTLREQFKVKITQEFVDLENEDLYLNTLPIVKDYDLYLITAGTLGDNEKSSYEINEFKRIHKINFYCLIPWIMSIANKKRVQKGSRLWVFSSVASDRGRPSNYTYGSSKAALTNYCEGLISKFYGSKFKVRLIKAGFMKTPMSAGISPDFLSISPKSVSKILLKNTNKSGVEYLPWWWFYIMKIIRMLPSSFVSKL